MSKKLSSQREFLDNNMERKSSAYSFFDETEFKKRRCHYGLKQKLMFWIITPLIICTLLIVTFAFLLIFFGEPIYIDKSSFSIFFKLYK